MTLSFINFYENLFSETRPNKYYKSGNSYILLTAIDVRNSNMKVYTGNIKYQYS